MERVLQVDAVASGSTLVRVLGSASLGVIRGGGWEESAFNTPDNRSSSERSPERLRCPPIASATLGVGSNDEDAESAVRGADVGRA